MGHACIQVIYDEHSSISAILKSLRMMIRRGPQNEPEIFFDVMRAMLFYIDEVPEKQHHPKETAFLFPPVAQRSPQCAELIEQLEMDHEKGEASVRELQHLLLGWEILGESRRQAFEEATLKFVDFYSEHLLLEESIIIPEALRVLTEEDWTKLNAAFEINKDPFSGKKTRDPIYDRLFSKIALRAPAPIGLGHE
jgi:hemerythrin-like domain-containing protein